MSLADDFDAIGNPLARAGADTTARRVAPDDSVPVSLFGDKQSPEARAQFARRVAELLKVSLHGPSALATAPSPQPPIMRAKSDSPKVATNIATLFGLAPK